MQNLAEKFDATIREVQNEIDRIENMPRSFEHLRYTPFELFENTENKRVYLLDNRIYIYQISDESVHARIDENMMKTYNSLKNEDDKFDFIGENGNWPTYNPVYLKEAIEDGYAIILGQILMPLKLKKAELCSKAEYYEIDKFNNIIIEQLDTYNKNLLSRDGQFYLEGSLPYEPAKLFGSKLDIISFKAMSYSYAKINGQDDPIDNISFDDVRIDYGYPGLYINWKQWFDFELSVRMIQVLKRGISNNNPLEEDEEKEKKNQFTTLEAVHFLDQLGFFTKMTKAEHTQGSMNRLAGQLIGRNYKQVEKRRLQITKKEISPAQKLKLDEIEKIVNSFINL